MSDRLAGHKVPAALLPRAAAVVEITDRFCAEHLDHDYAELCRRLVGRLGRKRPSPLQRGDLRIWSGAVVYTIGSLNSLFDPSEPPHLSASELCRLMDVSPATAANKARDIRNLLRLAPFDPDLSRREIAEQSPLRNLVEVGGLIVPADFLVAIDDDEDDDEAFLESLEAADRDALALLRDALPQLRGLPFPAELPAAAADLRRRLLGRDPELRPVVRANSWSARLPPDDRQLWIETVGALIAIKNDTGLPAEEESLLMTLDHADLLGAVLGAVRAGDGSPADAEDLTARIDACPEVDGEVDDDDRGLIEAAFDLLVGVWQAAGAIDADFRLTELGRWGLPRALAWAWGGDFDGP
ncbi:MAG: DUF6398 domain-containing protein [Candidatus Dormibacteria bacterium]